MRKKIVRTIPRSILIPTTTLPTSCDLEGDDHGVDAASLFDFSDASTQLSSKGIYYITGMIDEGSLLSIQQDLLLKHMDDKWQDDIKFFINSPGGSAVEMWALIDMMKFVKMEIWTTGLGQICSAAALILAAGSPGKRRLAPNTDVMIHTYASGMGGKHHELVAARKEQDLEHERHIKFWLEHTNLGSREAVCEKLLTAVDVFLSPEEALAFGIVDEVLGVAKPTSDRKSKPVKKGRLNTLK